MGKIWLFLCLFFCFWRPGVAQGIVPNTEERDVLIDRALSFYYNGKPAYARPIVEYLKRSFPDDAFFRELAAEVIWIELSQKVTPRSHQSEKADYNKVKENVFLVEQFKEEIFTGLVLTQEEIENRSDNPRALLLRGMLKVRFGGFIAKFESGLRSYAEADRETAEGLNLIKKAIKLDATLCSANYLVGLTKYMLLVKTSGDWLTYFAVKFKSTTYDAIDRRLDMNEVFTILKQSMRCRSNYYYTKDIEIDKMFVFQDILVKQAGRMDDEVLPVLEELNRRFPENKQIRDNLFLVRLHIRNRKR